MAGLITDFLKSWHDLQRSSFPSIDGILILGDILGFAGEMDFVEFAMPSLRELYDVNVSVYRSFDAMLNSETCGDLGCHV